jgi:predicted HAD superfamily Cof-like phosphohydrolase
MVLFFENRMQQQVEEFHTKFDQPIHRWPIMPLDRTEFRATLIDEEAKETSDALRDGDMVKAVDGMCDLLYVVFGTAVEMGIDLQLFFDEVHRTNMLKEGGGKRADGKVLKPPGWKEPHIKEILERLMAEAECER